MHSKNYEDDPVEANERGVDEVFERLYDRIRRLAVRMRSTSNNPTLNPTALAHEAYLKLRNQRLDLGTDPYEAVIPLFASAMRQILIDAARRKQANKRSVAALPQAGELPVEEALTIAAAVDDLERENARRAQIVRCRFLLGMTNSETAAALRLSTRTAEREWEAAKIYLREKIDSGRS